MQSCIYEGKVRHHRFEPITNRFTVGIYLMLLDLDELDDVFKRRGLWSTRKFSLAWFRQKDHFVNTRKHEGESLRWLATKVLAEHGITEPIGAIRLLTQLRYLGFAMNPVSFFYCFGADGTTLRAIIVEVNNTPWGEQHLYIIDANGQQISRNISVGQLQKSFHVSPFMPMEMHYSMSYTRPENKLAVRMVSFQGQARKLDVVMLLKRREITTRNLSWMLVRYPLITMKVFAGIYWQAVKLYRKKCPFFPHPKSIRSGKNQPVTGDLAGSYFGEFDKSGSAAQMHSESHPNTTAEMESSQLVGP